MSPDRVSRAERSRSSTERLKSSFMRRRSLEGTQADESVDGGKRVSLGNGTEWTTSLQKKIKSMLKESTPAACLSDRAKKDESSSFRGDTISV